jgi:hypothetical protein
VPTRPERSTPTRQTENNGPGLPPASASRPVPMTARQTRPASGGHLKLITASQSARCRKATYDPVTSRSLYGQSRCNSSGSGRRQKISTAIG